MCEGEFESLKAIHAVSPSFVPQPYAWGRYQQEDPETYFLLAEFRDVGEQVRSHFQYAAFSSYTIFSPTTLTHHDLRDAFSQTKRKSLPPI